MKKKSSQSLNLNASCHDVLLAGFTTFGLAWQQSKPPQNAFKTTCHTSWRALACWVCSMTGRRVRLRVYSTKVYENFLMHFKLFIQVLQAKSEAQLKPKWQSCYHFEVKVVNVCIFNLLKFRIFDFSTFWMCASFIQLLISGYLHRLWWNVNLNVEHKYVNKECSIHEGKANPSSWWWSRCHWCW